MSVDKSLKIANSLARQRNVLTRPERIAALRDKGEWDEEENSIFGMPKVRVMRAKRRAKATEKKAEDDAAVAEDGAAAEPTA